MKKILPFLTILIIVAIIVVLFISMSSVQNMTVVYTKNKEMQPIPIVLGKFQDSDCGMVIDDITYASQVAISDGKTWFFHDHGGMVHWLENKEFKDTAKIWVMTKDTKKYIDGRTAWYSRDEETPMFYGFGAYEHKKSKDNLIDFNTMSLYMIRGENMTNPYIKKQLLDMK
ncbi:MAG: hypothetical protein U9R37_01455 [Campylobacterota bacterium]|nr:hypothetical protein [Campylobacterota bacterium]